MKELAVFEGDPDELFYQCAIYEANNLVYDRLYVIYKILSGRRQPSDALIKKYFEKVVNNNRLDPMPFRNRE